MRTIKSAALFFLVLAVPTAWADQVTLKNGDRITGSIVKKDGKDLTIKSDLMGVLTVAWDQVADIKSNEQLNVVLAGQTAKEPAAIQAAIASDNGQITLSGGQGGPRSVAPAAIAAIRDAAEERAYERMLKPGLLQLWAGTATLGLAGTAGNAATSTFTLGANAARATRHDEITLAFNAVKSSATINGVHSGTAQAVRGGLKYNRKVGARLELDAFNDYEYDRFQNLDLRFVVGGGPGYRAWKGTRGEFTLQGGVDYAHDKFSPVAPAAAFSRNSSEGYFGDDFKYKVSGSTGIVQTFRMFANLTNTGAYRTAFDLSANTKLRKWLIWNLSFGDQYLSNPVPGRKSNDVLYTTGIGVTFGH